MDANFFYYSIYDRFIQRQPCACMRAFVNFFFKKTSQKVLTGFLPNFTGMFLTKEVKILSSPLQKNQACGAIEVLKHL